MAEHRIDTRKSQSRQGTKIPRSRKPEDMALEQWQIALRKQFAQVQRFGVRNIGAEPVFSEFTVTNPETGGEYRVAIRGDQVGDNYCSCPDFAVNALGTCKHIEFTLAGLKRKPEGKEAFSRGFRPAYSEVYLRYGAKREVVFRPGTSCPASLRRLAGNYFDDRGILTPEGCRQFDAFMKKAETFGHDLRCYEDTIEFIAQGTVEHGMLSLLSFKQSLFAGVLDKGQDEVFLGGTRLKRFMESVDKATGAIPESMPQKTEGGRTEKAAGAETAARTPPPAWDDLISAGMSFLNQLGRTLTGREKPLGDKLGMAVESDPATGQRHLRVPIPPKETLERLADLLHEWSKKI